MLGRLHEVVVDCADPEALGRFWHAVLGGSVHHSEGWVEVHPAGGHIVSFQQVAEPKVVKNRVHLDVEVIDVDAAVAAAVSLGATGQPTEPSPLGGVLVFIFVLLVIGFVLGLLRRLWVWGKWG